MVRMKMPHRFFPHPPEFSEVFLKRDTVHNDPGGRDGVPARDWMLRQRKDVSNVNSEGTKESEFEHRVPPASDEITVCLNAGSKRLSGNADSLLQCPRRRSRRAMQATPELRNGPDGWSRRTADRLLRRDRFRPG